MNTRANLTLSAAQLGVWHAQQAGASVLSYNIAEYTLIRGEIDPELFEVAPRKLLRPQRRCACASLNATMSSVSWSQRRSTGL